MQTQSPTEDINFDLDEDLIVKGEAELQDGPAITVGNIRVTLEHFIFESTGALDIVLGCSGVKVNVDDITDTEFVSEDRRMIVRTSAKEWCFGGRHIPRINARLQEYLAEVQDTVPDESSSHEYEYLHDQVDLYEEDVVIGEGRIRVTDSRLQMTPVLEDDAIRDAYAFDVRIDQIGEFWMDSIHSRLKIEISSRQFEFGGTSTTLVHEAICELLGTDPEDSLALSSRARSEVHRARLPKFLWTFRGELHLSTHGVSFVPTGLFKNRMNPDEHEVGWSEVCSISMEGWPSKRLVMRGRATGFRLKIQDLMHRYQDLVKTTFLALSEQDTVARRSLALFILDTWKTTLKWKKSDVIVFCDPAIRTDKADRCVTGAIVLTRTHALFLPAVGPETDEKPLRLEIGSIKRVVEAPDDYIRIASSAGQYVFRPSSGRNFVNDFWSRCQVPTKQIEAEEMKSKYMPRLIGETRSVRIFNQGQLIDMQRPGHAVAHPDGWAIVLRLDKLEFFQRLLFISIEVGQTEGVYQFDTRTLRLTAVPGHLRNIDHSKHRMLIAELPTKARVYNQRQALRRNMLGVRIGAKQMDEEVVGKRRRSRSFEAHVQDVSVGGLSLVSTFPLSEGHLVRVRFRLDDEIIGPEAIVTRVMPGMTAQGRTYGLRFVGLMAKEEDSIFQAVQKWQRAGVTGRFE